MTGALLGGVGHRPPAGRSTGCHCGQPLMMPSSGSPPRARGGHPHRPQLCGGPGLIAKVETRSTPPRFELASLPGPPIMTKAELMAAFDEIVTDQRLTRAR